MTILLIILTLLYPVMPPPWVPEQPLTLPLRVETTGGALPFIIIRDDGAVASINITPAADCWSVSVWDQAGQQYTASSPRGNCYRRLYVPLVEERQ